jgi:hypothetical protein
MAWKDITIRQYQRLYPVLALKPTNLTEELDQQIELLSILDGKPTDYYESITSKEFTKLFLSYEWAFTPPVAGKHPQSFKLKGVRYWVDYNPANVHSRLTGRDIIDLTTIANQEGVVVSNLNKILASYIVPSRKWLVFKRKVELEEALLDLDMQTAYDITAFFLPLLEASLKAIQVFLENQLKEQKEIVSTLIGDGKQPSTT